MVEQTAHIRSVRGPSPFAAKVFWSMAILHVVKRYCMEIAVFFSFSVL